MSEALQNARVTTHDGEPAIEIGDEILVLRTTVKVQDEDEPLDDRHVDVRAEADFDDGNAWWNVTRDDGHEEFDPYPWVTIDPEVVEDA